MQISRLHIIVAFNFDVWLSPPMSRVKITGAKEEIIAIRRTKIQRSSSINQLYQGPKEDKFTE